MQLCATVLGSALQKHKEHKTPEQSLQVFSQGQAHVPVAVSRLVSLLPGSSVAVFTVLHLLGS